jgi:hypothetical protein
VKKGGAVAKQGSRVGSLPRPFARPVVNSIRREYLDDVIAQDHQLIAQGDGSEGLGAGGAE